MTAAQKLLVYQFPACAEQMCSLRQKLREALARCEQTDTVVNNVVLAVGEACTNIIQHAYGPNDTGDIVLEVEWQNGKPGSNDAGSLLFRLTDFARHKTCAEEMRSRPLDEIRPGGLGCHIINEVMDEVVLRNREGGKGNVLELHKRL